MFIIPRPVLCVCVISHQYYSIRELFAQLTACIVYSADVMMLNTVCGDWATHVLRQHDSNLDIYFLKLKSRIKQPYPNNEQWHNSDLRAGL